MIRRPPRSPLFPNTTLFRSLQRDTAQDQDARIEPQQTGYWQRPPVHHVHAHRVSADEKCEQRSEEHTSELQSQSNLVCRLLLEKKNNRYHTNRAPPILHTCY